MKILTIIGARPQFIKASVVSRYIREKTDINEVIIHTGQHYDENMSDIFFEQMDIPKPNYFLNINGSSHGKMTGEMIQKIEEIILKENPNIVQVYGDTNTTLAGAIATSKLNIKLSHIESGLRSFNNNMPEEINRILTDRISDYLFCPTHNSIKNLSNEGFDKMNKKIILCGDVMKDVAYYYKDKCIKPNINITDDFILSTIHRAENTDNIEKLKDIFNTLNIIGESKQIILPLHPRTKNVILKNNIKYNNIDIINPVGYLEMVYLLKNCDFVMTDSGGLQKEAYFFNKFCLTLREETEWVELVERGYNILTGSNKNNILNALNHVKRDFDNSLYGDGNTSKIIIETYKKFI